MRTTRFILPLVALVLCVMPAAAMASDSGSTQAIVNDVAKDGKVDGKYTSAELKAAAASPLLKQYGGQGAVEAVVTTSKPQTTSKPATASKPETAATTTPSEPATGESGNLPFTGSDVLLFVAVGGALVAAGLVLRRIGRRDDEASA